MSKLPKAVTTAQLEQIRKMAKEKGVFLGAFQKALDDGTVSRFLDAIRDGLPINIGLIITPPPGGRLHPVRVPVNPHREWQEAINAAGPNTPADYNVRKVGDLYPVTTGPIANAEIILMNFGPDGGNWAKALEWAKINNLELTTPRQVFAIGEHQPKLHKELGMNPMYVVATTECTFAGDQRACDLWWHGAERGASLGWVGVYGDAGGWFAFVRKSSGIGS